MAIGRRIAGIAGSGSRTGNRFRLRGRSGVPWGAVRGAGVQAASRAAASNDAVQLGVHREEERGKEPEDPSQFGSQGADLRVAGVFRGGSGHGEFSGNPLTLPCRTGAGSAGAVTSRYRAERRLLLVFLRIEPGHGATCGNLAGGVAGYRRLRSPAAGLHDRGHLDPIRPGEVLGHPDPASVA